MTSVTHCYLVVLSMLITISDEEETTRNYIYLDTCIYNKCTLEYVIKMMGH